MYGPSFVTQMVAGLLETLNEAHGAMAPDPNDPKVCYAEVLL